MYAHFLYYFFSFDWNITGTHAKEDMRIVNNEIDFRTPESNIIFCLFVYFF